MQVTLQSKVRPTFVHLPSTEWKATTDEYEFTTSVHPSFSRRDIDAAVDSLTVSITRLDATGRRCEHVAMTANADAEPNQLLLPAVAELAREFASGVREAALAHYRALLPAEETVSAEDALAQPAGATLPGNVAAS